MESISSDVDSFLNELDSLQNSLNVMHTRLEKLNKERDSFSLQENLIDDRLLKLRRAKAESEALVAQTLFQMKEYRNTCTTYHENILVLCEEKMTLRNRNKEQTPNDFAEALRKKQTEQIEDELEQSEQKKMSLMCVKAHDKNYNNEVNMLHIIQVVHSHSALRSKWLEPLVQLMQDIAEKLFTFSNEYKKLMNESCKQFELSLPVSEKELFDYIEQN